VGALIELGAGFNPILSGRENIYNNGAILGFSKKEIDSKLEEIISFAELEEFIDMPVQNYSSGMKVRLGFAVAAQMEPDVLIVDEVLAVGDLGFRLKCFKTIDTILPKTAIIFVSHSMPQVSRLCNKIILMQNGLCDYGGSDISKGIDLYYQKFNVGPESIVFDDGSLEIIKAELLNVDFSNDDNLYQVKWGATLRIFLSFLFKKKSELPLVKLVIADKEQRPVALLSPVIDESKIHLTDNGFELIINHDDIQLSKGVYSINVISASQSNNEVLLRVNSVLSFQILADRATWESFTLKSELLKVNHDN